MVVYCKIIHKTNLIIENQLVQLFPTYWTHGKGREPNNIKHLVIFNNEMINVTIQKYFCL